MLQQKIQKKYSVYKMSAYRQPTTATRKQILIVYTGGTIGMMHHHQTNALVPFNFSKITDHIPELRHLNCNIHFHTRPHPIDSSNVNLDFWIALAAEIERNYEQHDGFV